MDRSQPYHGHSKLCTFHWTCVLYMLLTHGYLCRPHLMVNDILFPVMFSFTWRFPWLWPGRWNLSNPSFLLCTVTLDHLSKEVKVFICTKPMIGENRQLVTKEPVEVWEISGWSKTAGKLLIILEKFYRIYPNLIKENRSMSICNRLDLQTLGPQPVIMPRNLLDHCTKRNKYNHVFLFQQLF